MTHACLGVHEAYAEGIVDAPPSRVWALLTDFAHYDHIYTGIKRSEVRSRSGNTLLAWTIHGSRRETEQIGPNARRTRSEGRSVLAVCEPRNRGATKQAGRDAMVE